MSQEIDKRQEKPQTPPEMVVTPDKGGMCALSVVFVIVGAVSIVLGLVCASKFSTDYSGYWARTNYALVVLYTVGGVMSGMLNFALAVIVDACEKYRKSHNG